jgi:hypothetical protein
MSIEGLPKILAPWAERVQALDADDVSSMPVPMDWTELAGHDIDTYLDGLHEAAECYECGAVVTLHDGDGHRRRLVLDHDAVTDGTEVPEWFDDDDDAQDWLDDHLIGDGAYEIQPCGHDGDTAEAFGAEGPMMSYAYPVHHVADDGAARALVDLPVCLVEVDGSTYLALTGGGMDLSWEICAAYVALGHLPPVHFAGDLPAMAGLKLDATGLTLAAAWRSCDLAAAWAARSVERVVEMADRIARGES